MTPIDNSKPSELQPCAAAAPLTGVLIWKPPSKYGRSSKNKFQCGNVTGNPYNIQQTLNLAHQNQGGEYVKNKTTSNKNSTLLFPSQTTDHLCLLEEEENVAAQ